MKKLQMLTTLFFVMGSVNLCAGKTFRNSCEEPHAKKDALSKTWSQTGSKKAINRTLQSMQNTKLKKNTSLVAAVVNSNSIK